MSDNSVVDRNSPSIFDDYPEDDKVSYLSVLQTLFKQI